jgi:hypothetical protein
LHSLRAITHSRVSLGDYPVVAGIFFNNDFATAYDDVAVVHRLVRAVVVDEEGVVVGERMLVRARIDDELAVEDTVALVMSRIHLAGEDERRLQRGLVDRQKTVLELGARHPFLGIFDEEMLDGEVGEIIMAELMAGTSSWYDG